MLPNSKTPKAITIIVTAVEKKKKESNTKNPIQ
jgi:hypothetical protein